RRHHAARRAARARRGRAHDQARARLLPADRAAGRREARASRRRRRGHGRLRGARPAQAGQAAAGGRGAGAVRAAIIIAALVMASIPARAGSDDTVTHVVQAGDTLELLAAEYYGDRGDSLFIMAANKMLHPRPLKKGERIRVPVSREITTSVGDTF